MLRYAYGDECVQGGGMGLYSEHAGSDDEEIEEEGLDES